MKYYIVDAFTDQPFGGNPAGVVLLDSNAFPEEGLMLHIEVGEKVMMQMAQPRIVATIGETQEIYRDLGVNDYRPTMPVHGLHTNRSRWKHLCWRHCRYSGRRRFDSSLFMSKPSNFHQ